VHKKLLFKQKNQKIKMGKIMKILLLQMMLQLMVRWQEQVEEQELEQRLEE